MNIRQQLSKTHSRANADLVLNYVLADEGRVGDLLKALRDEEITIVQRAAMVVGDLGRARPAWLRPYNNRLLEMATAPAHDAVQRNILRHFSELDLADIHEDLEGPLLELAFVLTEEPTVPPGIRVFAMQVVANLCSRYPELKAELRAVLETQLPLTESPGFRSRAKKILSRLKR